MLSKHWKCKTAILTLLIVLQAIFLPAFAQTPSRQLATAQCTDMEIPKHIQELNKAEPSDFEALVACQSKAVPALIKALENKDEDTRIIITAALGEIGSQAAPAIPLLNELLLKDESRDVWSMTLYALRQIGTEAKDTVPALTAALEDEIESVRSSADNALHEMNFFKTPRIFGLTSTSKDVKHQTKKNLNNNPPVICRIPVIRTVLPEKCPKLNG